jgi:hypothetical protein
VLDLVLTVRDTMHRPWSYLSKKSSLEPATLARAEAERAEHARREAEEADLRVRRDVSRRLHGTIQQRLVLLAHRIERLAERDHDPELTAVAEELDEVRERDVRAPSQSLLPVGVDIGLREALQLALGRLPSTVWTSVTLDPVLAAHVGDADRPRMAVPDRLMVLDVVEEAVTNAVRHGGATTVRIALGRFTSPSVPPRSPSRRRSTASPLSRGAGSGSGAPSLSTVTVSAGRMTRCAGSAPSGPGATPWGAVVGTPAAVMTVRPRRAPARPRRRRWSGGRPRG